jgi:K+-sensing histidine kinase KdpD
MSEKLVRWILGISGVSIACLCGRWWELGDLRISILVHFIFPVIFGILAKYVFWNCRLPLVFLFAILTVTIAEISRIYYYSLVVGIDFILRDNPTRTVTEVSYLVQLSVTMAAAFGLHLIHRFFFS